MPLVDDALVGRTGELAQIDALLDRVEGGHASIVVVTGEAGIGKTALLDARRAGRTTVASRWRSAGVRPASLRRTGRGRGCCAPSGGRTSRGRGADVGGRAALFAAAADRLEQSSA